MQLHKLPDLSNDTIWDINASIVGPARELLAMAIEEIECIDIKKRSEGVLKAGTFLFAIDHYLADLEKSLNRIDEDEA
jgi:hypothetical protein